MILSIFTEVFTNRAGKLVFHVKKSDKYYLIDDKNTNLVGLFQNLLFNSISIAAVIGWIARLSYWLWIVIALSVYIGFTLYFNKKILPQLSVIKNEKAKRRKEIKLSNGRVIFAIITSFAIALGLLISLFYEPLNSSVDDMVVILGVLAAIALGVKYTIYYIRNK